MHIGVSLRGRAAEWAAESRNPIVEPGYMRQC